MTLRTGSAIIALMAASLILPDYTEGKSMPDDQNCVQEYPFDERRAPPWDIEQVERIWNAPLGADLILVGGVDGYGWARACPAPGEAANIFEGEYRDPAIWYRGRFRLETPEGTPAPADALKTHYASYFDHAEGLVLMPVTPGEPPVKSLRLVPLDTTGYAARP